MSTQEAIVNCIGIIAGAVAFCWFFYMLLRNPPTYTQQPVKQLNYQDKAWPHMWRSETTTYYKEPPKEKTEGYQPTGPTSANPLPPEGGTGLVTPKDHT